MLCSHTAYPVMWLSALLSKSTLYRNRAPSLAYALSSSFLLSLLLLVPEISVCDMQLIRRSTYPVALWLKLSKGTQRTTTTMLKCEIIKFISVGDFGGEYCCCGRLLGLSLLSLSLYIFTHVGGLRWSLLLFFWLCLCLLLLLVGGNRITNKRLRLHRLRLCLLLLPNRWLLVQLYLCLHF